MKKLLFSFIAVLLPLIASADAVEIGAIYYNLTNNTQTAEVTSNPNKYTGDIVIPPTVEHEGTVYDVTSIGNNAFYNCSQLTSVIIGNNVTSIGMNAFYYAITLTSVFIPNSVTYIGSAAFYGCRGLTSINIPNSVSFIGATAFCYCTSLSSINIPNNVTIINRGVFNNCTSLISISIPNSVTTIAPSAFFNCTSLTSISIPNSVTSIGDYAFKYCENLTSVFIPASVEIIYDEAFDECSSLTSVTVDIATPLSIVSSTFSNRANATLYVPAGSEAAYSAADYWKEFKEIKAIVPTSVSITLGKAQTTYCYDQPLNFAGVSGIRAYVASGFNPTTGALLLMHVDEVPANTGLLLKGTAGQTYEIPVEDTDFYYLNMLKGVLSGVTLPTTSGGYRNYFLKNGVFCLSDGTATVGANKAYLQLPVSTAGARAVIYYETDDGYTGVMDVMEDRHEAEDVYYNLNGQRIDNPKRGLYIQNGKKVVIK